MSNSRPLFFTTDQGAQERLRASRTVGSTCVALAIRGWKCKTESALHDEVGAALQFPDYYGENWNAFDECIKDLSWLPAERYVIVMLEFGDVLPSNDRGLRNLLEVLTDAKTHWEDKGIPFEVVLAGDRAGFERASSVGGAAVRVTDAAGGASQGS